MKAEDREEEVVDISNNNKKEIIMNKWCTLQT